uniref:Uncharacterized protein n=1 Tax=Oryza brachyantha TaxID=4533 RepID=J3MP26_ORYBR
GVVAVPISPKQTKTKERHIRHGSALIQTPKSLNIFHKAITDGRGLSDSGQINTSSNNSSTTEIS